MKKLLFLLIILILSACASNADDENSNDETEDTLTPISVEILMDDQLEVGEHTLQAKVTHNDEPVTEADEVEFEVWQQGQKEESTFVTAEEDEEGLYTAEYNFQEDGIYHIQSHVTAKSQHVMPKHQVQVGNPTETDEHEAHEDEDGHDHSHDHSHSNNVDVDFNHQNGESSGQEILNVNISLNDEPLEEGRVRFEIKPDDDEHPVWADAEETESGVYTSEVELDAETSYTVTVHIENDDGLHEHEDFQFETE
ncbi:FixH family protein [Piscibacillus halophilus]|uniref:YtkA-like n=1 Tax=Piscibacillus halophilus TaxID=571933 RepID=A0A1H9G4K7_9BACI|nr:FixH family protein [Piscibacillus halophilus]SEQ45076.1 YtkA-like [Piscibacillus halophilus]